MAAGKVSRGCQTDEAELLPTGRGRHLLYWRRRATDAESRGLHFASVTNWWRRRAHRLQQVPVSSSSGFPVPLRKAAVCDQAADRLRHSRHIYRTHTSHCADRLRLLRAERRVARADLARLRREVVLLQSITSPPTLRSAGAAVGSRLAAQLGGSARSGSLRYKVLPAMQVSLCFGVCFGVSA